MSMVLLYYQFSSDVVSCLLSPDLLVVLLFLSLQLPVAELSVCGCHSLEYFFLIA
jgi:hypothetical protein